eukprot:c52761_g1_i1.p1 GENE.c52761_g1_i1~~c52761_g1_i1.p1  ORF type:complete len:376 (+),score=60.49 c52761_g1_i1:86-1213(+)
MEPAPGSAAAAALEAKEAGNMMFALEDWEGALAHYSRGIAADPTAHVLFSNRCACYLKLGTQIDLALRDADSCVALQPSWAKGHARRGSALLLLRRAEDAAEAFMRVLELEPENAAAEEGLEAARAALAEQAERDSVVPVHTTTSAAGAADEAGGERGTKRTHEESEAETDDEKDAFAAAASAAASGHIAPETVIWVEDKLKRRKLLHLVTSSRALVPPLLVLVELEAGAKSLAQLVHRKGVRSVVAITEDMSPAQRAAAFAGEHTVKFASFAAAGGQERLFCNQVMLFDLPSSMALYLLLSNQTARFGQLNLCITMVNHESAAMFTDLAMNWHCRGIPVPAAVLASPACKADIPRTFKRQKVSGEKVSMLGSYS